MSTNTVTRRLTDANVRRIRDQYDSGKFTQIQLARKFKVSESYISRLVNFLRRTNVTN